MIYFHFKFKLSIQFDTRSNVDIQYLLLKNRRLESDVHNVQRIMKMSKRRTSSQLVDVVLTRYMHRRTDSAAVWQPVRRLWRTLNPTQVVVSLSLPSPYPTIACTLHLLVGHNELLMTFLTRRAVASWSESTFTPATAQKEGNIFTKDSPVHNLR